MVAASLYAVDGPDKPALQWALLYPERGQTVMFKIGEDIVEARISEMEEIAGFEFNLRRSRPDRSRARPSRDTIASRHDPARSSLRTRTKRSLLFVRNQTQGDLTRSGSPPLSPNPLSPGKTDTA